ncbi:MAG: HAMP domain-containing histidine kinase [Bacilli bacterium]|nr:HAMP domain-containing histidine kinase [Bacilli bacterium]
MQTMKSSIRSKLFLLVYGLILTFIAGLILLNNTFLENYYVKNRESSLIEAFSYIKDIDLNSSTLEYQVQSIENEYSLNVQILQQTAELDPNFTWTNFDDVPDIFYRIYGDQFGIPNGIISKIIYDFSQQQLGTESSYATQVLLGDSSNTYTAYLMDIQSEFNHGNENIQMIGLCVSADTGGDYDVYYVLTVSFQSITDSIKIFNTFTILVGVVFMVLSFAAMYFISYSFTNPILQITRIAEEISNLDFSNRVEITTDDELGDLGDSINRMSVQLEQNIKDLQTTNDKLGKEILFKTDVDKMRREFIASASHELKTPLSLIMGYAEAMKFNDLDEETKAEYLNIITDETNKMNKLVMDLLNLSQLENGSIDVNYNDFDVRALIEDTTNLFNLVMKEKQIKLELQIVDVRIHSDYAQLQTVLTNFINNAINHVDEKKRIVIKTEIAKNKAIRVSVFNTGVTIPEDEIKNIWDSFYKVDKARTRAYGGQGLGLSICRTTLDILGYDYQVINHEDGVEFYFEIL